MGITVMKFLDKYRDSILFVFLFFIVGQIIDNFILIPVLHKAWPAGTFVIGNDIYKVLEFAMYFALNAYLFKQKVYLKVDFTKKTIIGMGLIIILSIALTIYKPSRGADGVVLMLLTAIGEEYINRGLITGKITTVLFEGKKSYLKVFGVLIISGIIFALYHFSNIRFQPLANTLSQMIQMTGLGAILAALYLRTGSLMVPILVHFIWDYNITIQEGVSSITAGKPYFKESIVICLVFILIAVLITRHINKLRLIDKVMKTNDEK